MIRSLLIAAAAAAATPAASQVEVPLPTKADATVMEAQKDMGGMGMHAERLYTYTRVEADYARVAGKDAVNWDAEAWVGGDRHKVWFKAEGERSGRRVEQAEFQALYSRNIWTYFDAQAGLRYDVEPDRRGYVVIGVQGLAPYLLETELHAFLGLKGDVSVRLKQSFDLLMTNRLIVSPMLEADFYLNDARERQVKSGFSVIETGVQTRYELSRKFAPYFAAIYERRLGGTARLTRAASENTGGWSIRTGLRVWF